MTRRLFVRPRAMLFVLASSALAVLFINGASSTLTVIVNLAHQFSTDIKVESGATFAETLSSVVKYRDANPPWSQNLQASIATLSTDLTNAGFEITSPRPNTILIKGGTSPLGQLITDLTESSGARITLSGEYLVGRENLSDSQIAGETFTNVVFLSLSTLSDLLSNTEGNRIEAAATLVHEVIHVKFNDVNSDISLSMIPAAAVSAVNADSLYSTEMYGSFDINESYAYFAETNLGINDPRVSLITSNELGHMSAFALDQLLSSSPSDLTIKYNSKSMTVRVDLGDGLTFKFKKTDLGVSTDSGGLVTTLDKLPAEAQSKIILKLETELAVSYEIIDQTTKIAETEGGETATAVTTQNNKLTKILQPKGRRTVSAQAKANALEKLRQISEIAALPQKAFSKNATAKCTQ